MSMVSWIRPSRSSIAKFGLICPIGRPRSPGIRLKSCSARGVNRRMLRSPPTMTIGMSTLPRRFIRSLLTRVSSSLRECSSSLTVFSSSLVLCSSSLAVSSSSFVLCSSSLLDRISSLADCSSSLAASSSWMIDCRYSRLAASSRRSVGDAGCSSSADLAARAAAFGLRPACGLRHRAFVEQHQEVLAARRHERDDLEGDVRPRRRCAGCCTPSLRTAPRAALRLLQRRAQRDGAGRRAPS